MNIASIINSEFSGVISIRQNGENIFQRAYGYADIPNEVPNETDTKFGTASAGKVFVATAILQLIEQGRLSFGSTIGELLDFELNQIDRQITVRHLLNHTSGIPDYFDESVMDDYEDLWRDFPNYRIRKSSDLIPLFIDKPMMYPRGERFQYNNTGYVVLGLIIESVTQIPFDEYLQKMIFNPCEMNSTGYFELDRLPAKCASAYIFDKERNSYRTNIYSIDAKGTGAGGAFTAAGDVEKFWDNLMGEKLISRDMLKLMLSPQSDKNCYGYGVWLLDGKIPDGKIPDGKIPDGKIPSFQGCDPGVNFITSYDMENQICITILCNIDFDVESLHDRIYTEITGK